MKYLVSLILSLFGNTSLIGTHPVKFEMQVLAVDANEGKLFDTIETEATQTNYLTGKTEKIKVRKLPLAWTIANRVLIDQVAFLEEELKSAKSEEEVETILEKYGVGVEYGKGYSITSKQDVLKKLKRTAGNSLQRIEDDSKVVGKHSN